MRPPFSCIIGSVTNATLRGGWQSFVAQLKSWQLLALVAALFVLDLFLPDPIPFVDELLLGLLTLLLVRWKQRSRSGAAPEPLMKNVTPRR